MHCENIVTQNSDTYQANWEMLKYGLKELEILKRSAPSKHEVLLINNFVNNLKQGYMETGGTNVESEQFAQRIKPYRDDTEKMSELTLFFENIEEKPRKTHFFHRIFKK